MATYTVTLRSENGGMQILCIKERVWTTSNKAEAIKLVNRIDKLLSDLCGEPTTGFAVAEEATPLSSARDITLDDIARVTYTPIDTTSTENQ